MNKYFINCLIILINIIAAAVPAQNSDALEKVVYLHEDFNNLTNWKELYFAKIETHSMYSIVKDGNGGYLKAESNASASGIVFKELFNVFEFPKIRWRWKVSNVYKNGDARKKSGDDYPLRIYIIFKYDPDTAPFGKKMRYALVKQLYGEYPPDSSLNYIWANREFNKGIITNPYAAESKMVALQSGGENVGKWVEQEVNIIEDYHRAFHQDPPETVSIAIMNDSDNTGESAVSYIDYIEIYR